jgi:pimeloyl-ACP methyl ester carboxylesterase
MNGVPLVLLTHLAATLDEWDSRFVDALAHDRRIVAPDLPRVGGSTGRVPGTIAEMARAAEGFVAALGLARTDLLGFLLGGFVAQQVALDAPGLVRRLVLAGTGPAGGAGIDRPTGGAYVYWDMARAAMARTDAKEFLFFPRTPAGRQITAIRDWGRAEPQDLSRIGAPTLIANGDHDRMVPTELSYDMHVRIPGSTLIIYPEAGHGGVFQHVDEFVDAVRAHLHTDS